MQKIYTNTIAPLLEGLLILLLALVLGICLVLSLTITVDLGPIHWLLASFGAGLPALLLSLVGYRRYGASLALARFTTNSIIWAFLWGGVITAVATPLLGVLLGGLFGPITTNLTTKYIVPLLPNPRPNLKDKVEKATGLVLGVAFVIYTFFTSGSWVVTLAVALVATLALWAASRWPDLMFLVLGSLIGNMIADSVIQAGMRSEAIWLERIGERPITLFFIILGAIVGLIWFKILEHRAQKQQEQASTK